MGKEMTTVEGKKEPRGKKRSRIVGGSQQYVTLPFCAHRDWIYSSKEMMKTKGANRQRAPDEKSSDP